MKKSILLFVACFAFSLSGFSQIDKDQLALEVSKVDADNTAKLKEYVWKLHADVFGEGGNKTTLISEFQYDEAMMYLRENNISYIKDESNDEQEQDRNYIRNNIIPSIEQRWMKASSRISNTSEFIRMKNKSYEILLEEKFKHLIDKKIKVKDLREIDEPFVVDIIRHSIRKQSIAMPSKKVIEEIIKTFIQSNPGPKSLVSWTRADKDQAGGEICYKDGCIIISKK